MGIDQPASRVYLAGLSSQRREGGIVKASGPLQVIASNHDMSEHSRLQLSKLISFYCPKL
jgi:hypothetical protein